jgi:hypothetical protein
MTAVEELTPIMGGYHVKDLPDGRCVDVMQMMYNWRLVVSLPFPSSHVQIEHAWCYFGHGLDAEGHPRSMELAFLAAIAAARVFDGQGSPVGADKQAC